MSLTKQHLVDAFNGAKQDDSKYVFVAIKGEGFREVISIPNESFEAKLNFYLHAYTDELVHVMNKNIKITGLSHGDESALVELI